MNRHTKGNVQTASHLFGHTPEVEAKNYVHGVPAEMRLAGLALDSTITRDKQETALVTTTASDR